MADTDFGTHPGLPWPPFEALLRLLGENMREQENHEIAACAAERHRPVPDHGRWSDQGCLNPQEHNDIHVGEPPRPPVCKTCRDAHGDPVEAPCDDLADWGAFYGVDFS